MRSTFKTLFYVKRNEPGKNGNVVIMVRITIDGERSQFSSKLEVHPDLWDNKTGKIAAMESERQAFVRGKSSSRYKLENTLQDVEKNNGFIERISKDMEALKRHIQYDMDGNPLNPVRLNGIDGSNPQVIGKKLNEIADTARTHGIHEPIGILYGFALLVKSETTVKDGFNLVQNRFFVKGEGDILYSYNNGQMANDPKLAAMNFLHALETMPRLLEKYKTDNEKITQDIPVLKSVVEGVWKKEGELNILKSDLSALDRKIQLSLKPIEQGSSNNEEANSNKVNSPDSQKIPSKDTPMPSSLREIKEAMGERLVIASVGQGFKPEKKEPAKRIKL